jgi:enoyl-[acyl-carrier protein] reductase I
MGFLTGKRLLITGMLSSSSIAYGIACACYREGAILAFTYQNDRVAKRVIKLASEFGEAPCFACDVSSDNDITSLFNELANCWDSLDGLVHAIAFAPAVGVTGKFVDGLSRESFRIAHEISSYSFSALAKAALPLMRDRQGALLTLSYIGAQRAIPGYNIMGLAKASLEANVRYLSAGLGEHNTRVNGLSSGPIVTIASSGLENFDEILEKAHIDAPQGRSVNIAEVGNVAAFLISDLANGINGQIIYVDNGASIK